MGAPGSAAEIVVSAPALSRAADGSWRVSAKIGAHGVFTEADERLADGADAFLAAYLLPAARAGAALRVDGELDERLAGNVAAILAIARRDWGFPGAAVESRGLAR